MDDVFENPLVRTARCCCGDLAVTVMGDPEIYGVCHCKNCRARTGSAFGISAYFKIDQIISRSSQAHCYPVNNLNWLKERGREQYQERFFCGRCGTTLYWTVFTFPDMLGVAGGCFVDQPLPEPNYSMAESSKCKWLSLPTSLQRIE